MPAVYLKKSPTPQKDDGDDGDDAGGGGDDVGAVEDNITRDLTGAADEDEAVDLMETAMVEEDGGGRGRVDGRLVVGQELRGERWAGRPLWGKWEQTFCHLICFSKTRTR